MSTNLTPGGNRGQSFPAEVLSPAEVRALMDACREGALGDRNRALIALMYRAGLRVSEALALRPVDVDARAGTIRVLRGKGGKARTVGVDDTALRFLERWLAHRVKRSVPGERLFCSLSGEPLEPASVRQILRRCAARAGIGKRVHPHGLRHTLAAELALEGVPVHVIQQTLGHSNVSVTSRYINHLAPHEVVAVARGREWVT